VSSYQRQIKRFGVKCSRYKDNIAQTPKNVNRKNLWNQWIHRLSCLQGLFTVEGAALGFPGGAGRGTADVHAGSKAAALLIIRTVDGIALDVGLGLGGAVAGHHIAVVFASLGETAAAGAVFAFGSGAIHADALPDAQIILVVGAAADVASQITHGSKSSFPAAGTRLFSVLALPEKTGFIRWGKTWRFQRKNQKNHGYFVEFAGESVQFALAFFGIGHYNKRTRWRIVGFYNHLRPFCGDFLKGGEDRCEASISIISTPRDD
jgi:hypothetical protein